MCRPMCTEPRSGTGASIGEIVADLASALRTVDSERPQGRSKTRLYQPGVGPLTESEALRMALTHLRELKPHVYGSARSVRYPGVRQCCDLVLPGQWAIECKLIRPFGDNGMEAEHWSEDILHPYPGNISAIGDCLKLL